MYALILLALVGCQGNGPGDTGSNGSDGADGVDGNDGSDGSDGGSDFSARLEVAIPDLASPDVYVEANGTIAKCDADTRKCFYDVTEAGIVTITADYEGLFFAPLTITVTDEDGLPDENGEDKVLAAGWEVGGCSDTTWKVGDGFCPSWTDGQVACDLSGYWDEIGSGDWSSDLEMKAVDLDGDGQDDEVGIGGDIPFVSSALTNGAGSQFYQVTDAGGLISGRLVNEDGGDYTVATSCGDIETIEVHTITVTGAEDTWYIRRI